MARAPAIANLRNADLRTINEFVSRVRQRLEAIETSTPGNSDAVFRLQQQVNQLAAAVRRMDSTVSQPPPAAASDRNVFIQVDDPPALPEPVLWIIPTFDAEGSIIDAALVLRTT